uniref:transcription elongation factor GreA n=1 Tax=Immundisolibacter sp. TaxID=1934948 RepID=UPI0035630047
AAKEQQGFIEGRISEIEDRLGRAEVIDPARLSGEKVVFGATVTVVNLDSDEEVTYQVVGIDEADIKQGRVSFRAPLARALIGRVVGDEVVVPAPGGDQTYEILAVDYR